LPWFRRTAAIETERAAAAAYRAILAAARRPEFFSDLGVADSLDGRFDLLCLHTFLVLRRLRRCGDAESADFAQALFDAMFADMDAALRQIGVSDLRVGREVKTMVRAFLGRIDAYEAALAAGDETALSAALVRNVYRGAADELAAAALTRYMVAADAALAKLPDAGARVGRFSFPAPIQNEKSDVTQ
jgi:cytochrome b pre-mRNA-processing protein 3